MAAAIEFLHKHVSRDGAESDDKTGKSTSAISVDCNENEAIAIWKENIELKNEMAKEEKKSTLDTSKIEMTTCENNLDEVNSNDNKKEEPRPPQLSHSEVITTEEKSSTLASTVITTEVSQESSVSVCKTDASKLASNDKNNDSNLDESSSEESTKGSSSNNNKVSYAEIQSKRKTLLKIEKLTDSDSRSRNKMRKRALSPPSSSDKENFYIGWIAYPASRTSFRRIGDRPRYRPEVWRRAVKFIFYPFTKVCQKCVKTKVEAVIEE